MPSKKSKNKSAISIKYLAILAYPKAKRHIINLIKDINLKAFVRDVVIGLAIEYLKRLIFKM